MNRILVVEDDPDIADLIRRYLQRGGFEVEIHASGRDALAAVGSSPPDLILLDMRMPRMTGLEACRALKAQPGTASIPVVFLSGRGLDDEVQSGLDAGALAFIVKPFAPDELVSEIEQLLARVG